MNSGSFCSMLQASHSSLKAEFTCEIKGFICMISKCLSHSDLSMIILLKGFPLKTVSLAWIWIDVSSCNSSFYTVGQPNYLGYLSAFLFFLKHDSSLSLMLQFSLHSPKLIVNQINPSHYTKCKSWPF